jgi:hypothetical protein
VAGVSPCRSEDASTSSGIAAEHGRHAGGRLRVTPAANWPRPRYGRQAIAASTLSTPGQGGRGQLADAVPGDDDVPAGLRRVRHRAGQAAELAGDEQAHRDDQRLGDRGVLDRLGVAGGAQREQVGVGDRPGPAEEGLAPGELEPVGQHPGLLGTLSGGEDGQHVLTVPGIGGPRWGAARKRTAVFGGFLQQTGLRGRSRASVGPHCAGR